MLAPAHVSQQTCFIVQNRNNGSHSLCFCRAKLPAPGLLTVCSLENSQNVALFIQGMAMTNVVVCPSPGCAGCLVVITDHGPRAEAARALRHELLVDNGEGRLEGLEEERQKREKRR